MSYAGDRIIHDAAAATVPTPVLDVLGIRRKPGAVLRGRLLIRALRAALGASPAWAAALERCGERFVVEVSKLSIVRQSERFSQWDLGGSLGVRLLDSLGVRLLDASVELDLQQLAELIERGVVQRRQVAERRGRREV